MPTMSLFSLLIATCLLAAFVGLAQGFNLKLRYKAENCNKDHMIVVNIHGLLICSCHDGYYLSQRNALDINTARCVPCKICAYDKYNPYEIQPCGKYTNTLCCKNKNMMALMTRFGYQACHPIPKHGLKQESNVEGKAISGSQHHDSVDSSKCLTPNMISYLKGDGTADCRCRDGYYLKKRNVFDPSVASCTPCTDCKYSKYKPFQIQACSFTTDTLCCARPDMKVKYNELGYQECVSGDIISSTSVPALAYKYTGDTTKVEGYINNGDGNPDAHDEKVNRANSCSSGGGRLMTSSALGLLIVIILILHLL